MTNFCSLSRLSDVICILKPVDPKITLHRVIILHHFLLLHITDAVSQVYIKHLLQNYDAIV